MPQKKRKETKNKLPAKDRPGPQPAVAEAAADIDEKKMFRLMKRGDEKARDFLVNRYEEWVVNIARKYHSCFPKIEISELIAEGNRGLLDALQRFDAGRKVKFSTYAWFWIVKNIQEYISNDISFIEIPRRILVDLKKITGSINDQLSRGRTPNLEKISQKLDIDLSTVREILSDKNNLTNMVSLDRYLDDEDRTQTIADMLEDKTEGSMQDIMDSADSKVNVVSVMERLEPIERAIIQMRFGFNDNQFHSLKEVGKKLKITPSKAKSMETMAILKLKRILASQES